MIIDTTKTKLDRGISSILNDKISYSKKLGFYFTFSQKRAIFWEQMKEWAIQESFLNFDTKENDK